MLTAGQVWLHTVSFRKREWMVTLELHLLEDSFILNNIYKETCGLTKIIQVAGYQI